MIRFDGRYGNTISFLGVFVLKERERTGQTFIVRNLGCVSEVVDVTSPVSCQVQCSLWFRPESLCSMKCQVTWQIMEVILQSGGSVSSLSEEDLRRV